MLIPLELTGSVTTLLSDEAQRLNPWEGLPEGPDIPQK